MAHAPRDRFGLTWHPLLAGRILAHADRLDIVEVIPEGRFLETRRSRLALRTLSRDIPVAIHGVSLGLSSAEGVDPRRLDAFARLMDDVRPEHWSEHLAFVRAGGIELGHLAAPSRTALTLEATAENVHRACRHVGSHPMVENVATLIDPPASDRSEREWLLGLLDACPADLLLDLHNVVTNGRNLGYDPEAFVAALPAHRIRAVHLTGGADVEASSGERRILDDHRHAVARIGVPAAPAGRRARAAPGGRDFRARRQLPAVRATARRAGPCPRGAGCGTGPAERDRAGVAGPQRAAGQHRSRCAPEDGTRA